LQYKTKELNKEDFFCILFIPKNSFRLCCKTTH